MAERERIRRRTKQVIIMAYKQDRGCCICGEKDPIVLGFHHHNKNTKSSKLRKRNGARSFSSLSWTLLFKEMEKCVVICANCHLRDEYKNRKVVA